jgi:hypothetical protein
MDIPEETKRAAVRLTGGLLKDCDLNLYRIVREGWFRRLFRRVFGREGNFVGFLGLGIVGTCHYP